MSDSYLNNMIFSISMNNVRKSVKDFYVMSYDSNLTLTTNLTPLFLLFARNGLGSYMKILLRINIKITGKWSTWDALVFYLWKTTVSYFCENSEIFKIIYLVNHKSFMVTMKSIQYHKLVRENHSYCLKNIRLLETL